jgi:hypothetical protein
VRTKRDIAEAVFLGLLPGERQRQGDLTADDLQDVAQISWSAADQFEVVARQRSAVVPDGAQAAPSALERLSAARRENEGAFQAPGEYKRQRATNRPEDDYEQAMGANPDRSDFYKIYVTRKLPEVDPLGYVHGSKVKTWTELVDYVKATWWRGDTEQYTWSVKTEANAHVKSGPLRIGEDEIGRAHYRIRVEEMRARARAAEERK